MLRKSLRTRACHEKEKKDMWQSWVEIEYYFVADFDCNTSFSKFSSVKLVLRVGLIRAG